MFRSNQSNKSQEIIIIHFLLIGAIVLHNGLLYSNTVFQKTTFEANQSGLNYHSKNFRRGGDESERIFIFLEWQLSSWWWGEKVVGFFFGFLRLAEPPAFQITLEALDVRNSFQNDVQFADVFLTFDGWNEFLQSSVRIDFGVFLSHVSVLFHHSPGCFLVVGGWQHWCHLHTHDFWWILSKIILFSAKIFVMVWSAQVLSVEWRARRQSAKRNRSRCAHSLQKTQAR